MSKSSLLIITLFFIFCGSSVARDVTDPYEQFRDENNRNEFEFDETLVEPWKERVTKIPVLNVDQLQKVDIDHGPIGADVYIDLSTVEVFKDDRVVRYWMVLQSGSGRYGSMSYEGIRCGTQEYKIYGHTSARRTSLIRPVKRPSWRPIKNNTRDPHHELSRDFFCSGVIPRTQRGVLTALKGHVAPRLDSDSTDLLKR